MIDALVTGFLVISWTWLFYSYSKWSRSRRIARWSKKKVVIPERISDYVTCHNLNRLDNREWGRYCNTVVALKHDFPVFCPTCGARVF